MTIRRYTIPSRTKKLIFQEAGSQCPFCDESEVAALEIHHIIGVDVGGSNGPENLILVCSTCHSKITQGVIPQTNVVEKKRNLIYGGPRRRSVPHPSNVISIDGHVSRSIVANTVRFAGKSSPRMQYPAGSVGANIHMKNYLDYLIRRYFEYRKADASFGEFGHARKFHPAEIHTSVHSKFKAKTFFVPEQRFEAECEYIQQRIDRTILGKRNKSRGIPNFQSFEAFLAEQS